MAIDFAWLGNKVLGRELTEPECGLLASMVNETAYASGDTIISTGQDGGVLHIMRSGNAKVEVYKEGEERVTVADIDEESIFGELTFLNNNPATADVIATQDCVVYKLSRQDLASVTTAGQPQLAYLFFSAIMERQTGVILEQRVTLAPELRNQNNQGMPVFAKIVIAAVLLGIVYIIATS
ncbi:DNA-binding transcriptional dual regulator Crp [Mariprofundus micogutta]|uniref:DNA-binding transcriptional dual regulator Crp n=1 Tax=Mariprofundus micogutta TaxID=1921010 RepID=A0A1L8CKT6_9PROT|nr:cyclic nucleotide-binding domain-containing protein [Mariprofundus micogutta]GAV19524.1 DNA-binding transcriptional dual regulator Crp [Mariprofundus micogutta]